MGTALEQYLADQRAKEGDQTHFQRRTMGFATEDLHPYIPVKSMGFIQSLGVSPTATRWTDLPDPVKVELAKLQPAVSTLGPGYDFGRLAEVAESYKDKLPPEVYFKLAGTAAIGQARQIAGRGRAAQESALLFTNEVGRQVTFGAVPAISPEMLEGADLGPKGVAITKALGAMTGIGLSGKLVYSVLSKVSLLPKVGTLVSQVPQRIREITLGVGTGAVLDAARPDGLPPDPAAIDLPARIAHPIAHAMGDSELAQRVGLAIGGGATFGIVAELLGPVLRGINLGREAYIASKVDPALMEVIREKMNSAGIGVTRAETNRSVIAKMMRNLDKIGQSEKLAGISALDETRTEFILQQLYSDPAFSGPPRLPNTRIVDETGAPKRMFHGSLAKSEGGLSVQKTMSSGLFNGPTPETGGIYLTDNPNVASGYARLGAAEETPLGYGFTHERLFVKGMGGEQARVAFEARNTTLKTVSETPKPGGTLVKYVDIVQPNVQPVYADIRNPLMANEPWSGNFKEKVRAGISKLDIDAGDAAWAQEVVTEARTPFDVASTSMGPGPSFNGGELINRAAREAGFDGIIHTGGLLTGVPPHTVAVAFKDSQVIPAFVSDDAKLLAGVFRANPGGMSIAKGITNVRAADEVVKRLGLNVTAIRAGDDYLLLRPQINYPIKPVGAQLSRQMEDFTEYVRASNRGKPTTRMAILPDGTPVRGDYTTAEMVSRYKIKPPIVAGAELSDVALREHFGMVDVRVEQGGRVSVQLPSTISQRQADVLGRIADHGVPEMAINSAKPGLSRVLTNPFGMQVQDVMADMVQGASRPKIGVDVMAKVAQYQKTGVFEGQAAHLSDGYPVEVLRKVTNRKGVSEIIYRDPLTQTVHRAGEDNIAILPTSLEGEHAPTNAFMDALDPVERQAFATLRRGINEDLAKPIKTFSQLESFAATRGKLATSLGKGQVRLHDPNTGESKTYEDFKAAITGIKNSVGPLPDLTPPEIEEILGYKPNIGGIGNGGPPARFGEPVAITEDEFDRAANTNTLGKLVPGAVEQFFTPTRGLMLDLERRTGMPFGKVFLNLQNATVHRQNFNAAWVYGEGPGLPEGVKPLAEIYKQAGGKAADQRLITAWLESESDAPTRARIEAQMKPQEVAAAQELRKWYGVGTDKGLFGTFGIESEFLTDYAPHIRQNAEGYGNDVSELWRRTRGTPLPKAIDFFADYSRDGSLNVYEDRAFVSAAQYLNAGARSRFMSSAMDDAKRLLRAIPDNAYKAPLANYVEALRGSEFAPQRAALDASFTRFMRTMGASEKVAGDIGERLTLNMLGLSYSATMAFRPGLAIRNAAQIYQTLWPLVGRLDDTFAEGIGRAMTTAGRDDAIRAGAIAMKQSAVFAGEEVAEVMPAPLKAMSEMGMRLYDGADDFTRSVSFHVAKLQSQRAIEDFGKALQSGENLAEAQRTLIKRSGAMVLDKPIVDEYLRRVATSPDNAGDFLGKQITDVTQFLYGRGNQPRWMRSVPGRFFGQFGTWPLWFIDYTKRSFMNMWRNGYQAEALAFIGKIALVDTAIYEAGKSVGLDFRRWMAGNSLFYTGGPAFEVVIGARDLIRGLSEEYLGTYESPATKQRIAQGVQTLQRVGQAFIPNMYAIRDIGRLMNAQTPTELLGAVLAVRPNTDYTVQQRLDLLLNPGRLSTDIDLENKGTDTRQTAAELMIRGMQVGREKLMVPGGAPLPTQPQGFEARPGGTVKTKVTVPAGQRTVQGRPPLEPTALPPEIRKGESKPVP